MADTNFKLYVPEGTRKIACRFRLPSVGEKRPPLMIMATGLYSYMDKESQEAVAQRYLGAGFAVLQFNFMGHGYPPYKSDGDIKDITLSSSINDLTAVWNYSRQLSEVVNTDHTVLQATSYGALTAMMAEEQGKIAPEAMISISPYSFYKLKPWALPLSIVGHILPNEVKKALHFNIPVKLLDDFMENHPNALKKKGFMGNTAIHFFVGEDDKISSAETVKSWTNMINYDADIGYPGGRQAQYTIYPGVKHFYMPEEVGKDIFRTSLRFVKTVAAQSEMRKGVTARLQERHV